MIHVSRETKHHSVGHHHQQQHRPYTLLSPPTTCVIGEFVESTLRFNSTPHRRHTLLVSEMKSNCQSSKGWLTTFYQIKTSLSELNIPKGGLHFLRNPAMVRYTELFSYANPPPPGWVEMVKFFAKLFSQTDRIHTSRNQHSNYSESCNLFRKIMFYLDCKGRG